MRSAGLSAAVQVPSVAGLRTTRDVVVSRDLAAEDDASTGRAERSPRLKVPETVVMKFGGTLVADVDGIRRAARLIVAQRESGKRVVAVLSARGRTTDDLISMAEEISPDPDRREMDMLLSTGERVSCALCAMTIKDFGHRVISLSGSQAGIVTDACHTTAKIIDVRADRIAEALGDGRIVLVAGFQGVSRSREITTLGRGGSDATAVAVAAAVGAEVCEMYSDVAGVFTADPRIASDARKLARVSFEEMLDISSSGARVLQLRSVDYARAHGVRIHCRSSFDPRPGTVVLQEDESIDHGPITAVTHAADVARITLLGVPSQSRAAAAIFIALADANCNVDRVLQNRSRTGKADMSFTVGTEDLRTVRAVVDAARMGLPIKSLEADLGIGKVSVVGAGMRSHPGVAAKVFQTMAREGLNIEMVSTSPIKISCVIRQDDVLPAVRALHSAFELAEVYTSGKRDVVGGPAVEHHPRGRSARISQPPPRATARARI